MIILGSFGDTTIKETLISSSFLEFSRVPSSSSLSIVSAGFHSTCHMPTCHPCKGELDMCWDLETPIAFSVLGDKLHQADSKGFILWVFPKIEVPQTGWF